MVSYNQNVYFHNQIISVDSRVFSEMKNRFAFRSLEKTAKFHEKKMQKFWGKKVENIAKKYGREINAELLSRVFSKNYSIFFLFQLLKKCEISRKSLQKRTKIFAFFCESFHSLETL